MYKINKNRFRGGFSLYKTILSDQCPSDLWSGYKSFLKGFDGNFYKFEAWEDEEFFYYKSSKRLDKEFLYMFWNDYPLDDFYRKFRSDKYISRITSLCKGLRPMRDLDVKYRIIESIITQNSNLKRIRKLDRLLREKYGNRYTYDVRKLAGAKLSELKEIGLGYRAEYILGVARKLVNGELKIDEIKKMSTEEARKRFMSIKGIGPKVADIILGFGFGKRDVFPMDVWLKRAIRREYFGNENVSGNTLRNFALNYFGDHAQVAHVYIYCYERKLQKERAK